MPIVYREMRSCRHCGSAAWCEFARREFAQCVRHINEVAVIAQRRLPDGELVFDCHSEVRRPAGARWPPRPWPPIEGSIP